ncbi:pancreatic secretory granule membrane major glycoprotein GP2-like isoform X1 [Scyliorhinus torazame]|uniref:pancreatic secretory granule membrane major glycoprotein GP2-like isoform X1 n=1 Tax=Scyliorhinus torazame TaxID=75743 RepID=UPI003B5C574D
MKTLLLILGYLTAVSISVDPCVNHEVLDQPWRSVKCLNQNCSADWQCDRNLVAGWYRFNSPGGSIIPETVVPINHCSTHASGWLNGVHPTPGDGEVRRRVCFHWSGNTCQWTQEIKIKRCSDYFVYYLSTAPACSLAYCTADAVVPTPPPRPQTTPPPRPQTTLPLRPQTTLPLRPQTTLPPRPQTTRSHIASSNAASSSSGVNGKEFKLVIKLMGDFDLASIQKIILELKLSLRNRFPDLDLHLSVGDD